MQQTRKFPDVNVEKLCEVFLVSSEKMSPFSFINLCKKSAFVHVNFSDRKNLWIISWIFYLSSMLIALLSQLFVFLVKFVQTCSIFILEHTIRIISDPSLNWFDDAWSCVNIFIIIIIKYNVHRFCSNIDSFYTCWSIL